MKREFCFDFIHEGIRYSDKANFEIHKTVVYNNIVRTEIHVMADPFASQKGFKLENISIIFTCLN